MDEATSRAQGCLLGQLAGDALGSLVEFQSPEQIRRAYPGGIRELANGGTWNTLAGQPTDDSELALLLARMLVKQRMYVQREALNTYRFWLDSSPFDCGSTILTGLRGRPNPESQANGALMRISPLGIFGAYRELNQVARWAKEDALLTHPHPVCQKANALFAMAISRVIRTGGDQAFIYDEILTWAKELEPKTLLVDVILRAADAPPDEYVYQQGWVVTAFHNALWQLLHAPNVETGVVDTVMRGGDTDTNAAICGALLGAVHGRDSLPSQWVESILSCRPEAGHPGVRRPRPSCFWPTDALEISEKLLFLSGDDVHDDVQQVDDEFVRTFQMPVRLISVPTCAEAFIETNESYESVLFSDHDFAVRHVYPKDDYSEYEHFVGIMSKFDPYTSFLKEPATIHPPFLIALEEVAKKFK